MTSLNPSIRATPSPVSRTTPTLLLVVDVFSPAIFVSISSRILLMIVDLVVVDLSKLFLQTFQSIAHTAVPNVAAHPNAYSTEKLRGKNKFCGLIASPLFLEVLDDSRTRLGTYL